MLKDKWWNRIQFEIGIRFDLVPHDVMGNRWRKWFFDAEFSFVKIGDQIGPPTKKQLPKTGAAFCDAVRNGVIWEYYSRCFWLAAAIRVFGIDFGIGFFYRKEYTNG